MSLFLAFALGARLSRCHSNFAVLAFALLARFSGYNYRCFPSAAIGLGIDTYPMPYWSTNISVRGVVVNKKDGTLPVWMVPAGFATAVRLCKSTGP